jgi:hypothetical protein
MSTRATIHALLALLLILLACSGEVGGPPEDDAIQTALPMEVNGILDDRVSADDDALDWKYFQYEVQQDLYLLFFFDEPGVKVEMTLFTGAGNRVASLAHDPSNEFDLLQVPDLRQGRYYLQIEAESGASVYTIRSSAGEMPMLLGSGPNTEPRPE